ARSRHQGQPDPVLRRDRGRRRPHRRSRPGSRPGVRVVERRALPSSAPVLILPGYGDSGPDHWQSHWERDDPTFRRVMQEAWLLPKMAVWVTRLEEAVAACVRPPVFAAHSLACSLVAHWATRPGARAVGALLVAPADVDSPAHTADEVRNFSPVPLVPL